MRPPVYSKSYCLLKDYEKVDGMLYNAGLLMESIDHNAVDFYDIITDIHAAVVLLIASIEYDNLKELAIAKMKSASYYADRFIPMRIKNHEIIVHERLK